MPIQQLCQRQRSGRRDITRQYDEIRADPVTPSTEDARGADGFGGGADGDEVRVFRVGRTGVVGGPGGGRVGLVVGWFCGVECFHRFPFVEAVDFDTEAGAVTGVLATASNGGEGGLMGGIYGGGWRVG